SCNWRPGKIRGVHEHRCAIARLRINHLALVHMLPDGLIGVHVALAGDTFLAMEDAILEFAEGFQLLHSGFDFAGHEIAAARCAAKLQHRAHDGSLVDLWSLMDAFGIITEHPGSEAPVAVIGLALDHVAELIEIVPVPRAGIIRAEPGER